MRVESVHTSLRISPSKERFLVPGVVLVFLVFAIILTPSVTIRAGIYAPRGEDFIVLVLFCVWFASLPAKRGSSLVDLSPANSTASTILLLMAFGAIVSTGIGTIAFGQNLIVNDLMILPMLFRYWLILQIGRWVFSSVPRKFLIRVLGLAFVLCATVGILQYFNLFGVNDWLTPLYVADSRIHIAITLLNADESGGRTVGTNGDPRHYAYLLAVGMGLGTALLANMRQARWQLLGLSLVAFTLIGIVTTASRTAVLSCAIMVLATLLLAQSSGRSRLISRLLVAGTVLGIVFSMVTPAFESSTFNDRTLNMDNESFDRSLGARIRDFTAPFEVALETPLIWITGRGPSKAELRTNSHNDFGWYFYRFGLPGLFLYLALLAYGLRIGVRTWKFTHEGFERVLGMTLYLLIINWFVFAMAENIFKSPQLMALNMFFLGIGIGLVDLLPLPKMKTKDGRPSRESKKGLAPTLSRSVNN